MLGAWIEECRLSDRKHLAMDRDPECFGYFPRSGLIKLSMYIHSSDHCEAGSIR